MVDVLEFRISENLRLFFTRARCIRRKSLHHFDRRRFVERNAFSIFLTHLHRFRYVYFTMDGVVDVVFQFCMSVYK